MSRRRHGSQSDDQAGDREPGQLTRRALLRAAAAAGAGLALGGRLA